MEEYQQELFDNLDKSGSRRKRRVKKQIFDRDKIRFYISYEQLGIVVIVFIVFLSIIFTLGVERGKKLANIDTDYFAKQEDVDFKVDQLDKKTETDILEEKKDDFVEPAETVIREFYTVQVVTYNREDLIKNELNYLSNKGYEAFVLETSGRFDPICVGRFQSKEEAQAILPELRKRYKDCFIRRVRLKDE